MFKPFGHRAVSHPAELKVKPDHPFTPENPKADSLLLAASFHQIIKCLDCRRGLALSSAFSGY
jgi:hypothetical protein